VGISMKFYYRKEAMTNTNRPRQHRYKKALRTMHRTRLSDDRPFGEKLGDAVQSSIQTLLVIGGFIMLFSVFTHLLHTIHFFEKVIEPFIPLSYKPLVTPFFT